MGFVCSGAILSFVIVGILVLIVVVVVVVVVVVPNDCLSCE